MLTDDELMMMMMMMMMMIIQQLNTTEGRDGNGAERYYHSERGGDDAEGQRRSDGYTFLMLSVCALRSGRVSGLVPRTLCISLVLHDR